MPAPAVAAPVVKCAPTDTVERVVDTVGRTHQIDDIFSTYWDTTRCQASSAVAIAALSGPTFVDVLAAHVVRDFEHRIGALGRVAEDIGSDDPSIRERGLRAFLPELQRHANAFRLSMRTALTELGYMPSAQPGIGLGVSNDLLSAPMLLSDGKRAVALSAPSPMKTTVTVADAAASADGRSWYVRDGVGPELASNVSVPTIQRTITWSRIVANAQGVEEKVALQTKEIEVADAGLLLAVHQLTGEELKLVERVRGLLEAELDKASATLAALRAGSPTRDRSLLQRLADSLLVAQQHSASGLNVTETSRALRIAGLRVERLERAVPWRELAQAVKPGEFLVLEGIGHAIAFGRLTDGRTIFYDPEGVLGERQRPCLSFVEPGRDTEIDQHYGPFQATHRIRPPRLLDVHPRSA